MREFDRLLCDRSMVAGTELTDYARSIRVRMVQDEATLVRTDYGRAPTVEGRLVGSIYSFCSWMVNVSRSDGGALLAQMAAFLFVNFSDCFHFLLRTHLLFRSIQSFVL